MKVLTTEQQTDLRNLLGELAEHQVPIGLANTLNYWIIELKPKRIRKPKLAQALDIAQA